MLNGHKTLDDTAVPQGTLIPTARNFNHLQSFCYSNKAFTQGDQNSWKAGILYLSDGDTTYTQTRPLA